MQVDYRNFTYATNPCAANVPVPAVMRDGAFSYFDRTMGAGFSLSVVTIVRGSLQPGTQQAVVVLRCDFPIGGTAAAYVFAERGDGSAKPLGKVADANWGAEWGAGPAAIQAQFAHGRLIVSACANTACTQKATTSYELRAGKLIRTSHA